MRYLALIPLLPLLGAAVNGLVGIRYFSKQAAAWLACATVGLSFAISLWSVAQLMALPPEARAHTVVLASWLPPMALQTAAGVGTFAVDWALRLDPLSAVMILVVSGIGFLIHVYSTAYMHDEPRGGYVRFFTYLNLFVFFMLTLVLGANFLVMFVGWEGVGLCSYLLIGYWYQKDSAANAGKKAFITNRVGDFGFILGMFLIFYTFGTLDFRAVADAAAGMPVETAAFGVLSVACLCLFVGATGKSAQIPLYVWLPDAMEGPTPVSALIHAATMVTAGVYMIGRNAELFSLAPMTLQVVAVIGACTALMAGTIGIVQNDIKRVLAYSTVSQLGYMFLAMGVGAFSAGIFHLYTHAFFKALMFLGSGAVIHALHGEQDMRYMGGLKKELPVTYWTFIVGALAIVGFPALSGFFSKDEILFYTFYKGHHVLWVLGMATALLTATYMFRLVYMTFFGERRHAPQAAAGHDTHGHDAHGHGGHGHGAPAGHLHDAPPAMAIPLVLLAIGAAVAGYVGVPHALGGHNQIERFLEPSFHPAAAHRTMDAAIAVGHDEQTVAAAHAEAASAAGHTEVDEAAKIQLERALMAVSVGIALLGIGIATLFWKLQPERAERAARALPWLHRLLYNKYYVDEVYDAAVVQPIRTVSDRVLWRIVDAGVIDGMVNGTGATVRGAASLLRLLQTGSVRAYAASLFVGVVLVLAYYLAR